MSIFEAFEDLNKNTNIICKQNYEDCPHCAMTKLDEELEKHKQKIGYAYWTEENEYLRIHRNLFYIGFHNRFGKYDISNKDIAETVCKYLTKHNVNHMWTGEEDDMIVVVGEGGT